MDSQHSTDLISLPKQKTHKHKPHTQRHSIHNTAGEELCGKVQYLGTGGLQLLVGGKLTVGFLSQHHTEADVGACVLPCVSCSAVVLVLCSSAP